MREFLTALFLCFLFGVSVGAQPKTDREILGLVGPVKTLSIRRTETWLLVTKPGDPKEGPQQLITFDEHGHKVQEDLYNPDGTLWWKWVYSYHANGYKSEESRYDASGRLILRNSFQYEFDAQGKLITLSIYDADGRLYEKMIKNYNSSGLMSDSTTYDRDGSIQNKSVFTYEQKGSLPDLTLYNSKGVIVQKQIRSPSQSESVLYTDDGTLKWRELRSAPVPEDYDARGNWTTQTTKKVITQRGRSGEVVEVVRRLITYY